MRASMKLGFCRASCFRRHHQMYASQHPHANPHTMHSYVVRSHTFSLAVTAHSPHTHTYTHFWNISFLFVVVSRVYCGELGHHKCVNVCPSKLGQKSGEKAPIRVEYTYAYSAAIATFPRYSLFRLLDSFCASKRNGNCSHSECPTFKCLKWGIDGDDGEHVSERLATYFHSTDPLFTSYKI